MMPMSMCRSTRLTLPDDGLFGCSIILWHITLGHREPPVVFFALLDRAHLFAIACLACMAIGALQVRRGWRSIDQLRGHLAVIHAKLERRLTGRYPAEIAPLAADVNRLLDQRVEFFRAADVRGRGRPRHPR